MSEPAEKQEANLSLIKTGKPKKRRHPIVRGSINIAPMDMDDMKVLYQNYKLETLPWELPYDLEPREVLTAVQEMVENYYSYVWSVRDRSQPVLIVFAKALWDAVFLDSPVFSPRSSNRQRYESSVALLKQLKEEVPALIASTEEQKPFFERLQDHKILRKVGTLHDMPVRTLFQTRA